MKTKERKIFLIIFHNKLYNPNSIKSFESSFEKLIHGEINFVHLGIQDYREAWNLQKKIHEMNKKDEV